MSFKSSVLFSVLSIAALAMPTSAVVAQGEGGIPGIKPATVATEMSEEEMTKKVSMILFHNQIKQMKASLEQEGVKLDTKSALEGVRLAFEGKEVGIPLDEIASVMGQFQKKMIASQKVKQAALMEKMKALAAKNKIEGDAYLAENGKKEGVKTLDNGVQYEVMVAGTGPKPKSTDKIRINYLSLIHI